MSHASSSSSVARSSLGSSTAIDNAIQKQIASIQTEVEALEKELTSLDTHIENEKRTVEEKEAKEKLETADLEAKKQALKKLTDEQAAAEKRVQEKTALAEAKKSKTIAEVKVTLASDLQTINSSIEKIRQSIEIKDADFKRLSRAADISDFKDTPVDSTQRTKAKNAVEADKAKLANELKTEEEKKPKAEKEADEKIQQAEKEAAKDKDVTEETKAAQTLAEQAKAQRALVDAAQTSYASSQLTRARAKETVQRLEDKKAALAIKLDTEKNKHVVYKEVLAPLSDACQNEFKSDVTVKPTSIIKVSEKQTQQWYETVGKDINIKLENKTLPTHRVNAEVLANNSTVARLSTGVTKGKVTDVYAQISTTPSASTSSAEIKKALLVSLMAMNQQWSARRAQALSSTDPDDAVFKEPGDILIGKEMMQKFKVLSKADLDEVLNTCSQTGKFSSLKFRKPSDAVLDAVFGAPPTGDDAAKKASFAALDTAAVAVSMHVVARGAASPV